MKIFFITFLSIYLLTSPAFARNERNTVLLDDFRGLNVFEVFYACDKSSQNCTFVPLERKVYKNLSKENKEIYKKVRHSNRLLDKSDSAMFTFTKIKYRQDAFKENPGLINAAYELSSDFKKEKKYSTALYYIQKVQSGDKKGFYKDADFKAAELWFLMGEYKKAVSLALPYLSKNSLTPSQRLDCYALLAASYAKTGDFKQANIYADKALSLNSTNVSALEAKYASSIYFKSYKTADSAALKLAELHPQNAEYNLNCAKCKQLLNDKKSEQVYLQRAKHLMLKNPSKYNKELVYVNSRIKELGNLKV